MIHSTDLIVLASTRTGEKNTVLHTLSSKFGRRSFLASSLRGTVGMPLNVLNAEITENPRSDLWRAGNLSVKYPLNSIRGNIYKNTMTLFLGEALFRTLREGPCEDGLFDWCEKSILTLDALESDFGNFHLLFLLQLASFLGFCPGKEDLPSASALLSLPYEKALLLPMSGQTRSAVLKDIVRYLSAHLEYGLEIRSLSVLENFYHSM